MARRYDDSRISNLRRTPSGGVVVEGALTRTGIFEYKDSSGKVVREWRSPEEVFKADSLESLKGAVVTERHPPVMVTPDNWRTYGRGNVVEGSIKVSSDHVLADLAVNDSGTIKGIDSGSLCELSCGYDCDLDNAPGVTPNGEAYDRAQRNIRYNHVAIGPEGWARGGSTVCLRLDSNGNQCFNVPPIPQRLSRNTQAMIRLPKIERLKGSVLRVDGVEYRLKTAEGRAQAEAAIKSANERLKSEAASGRTDGADGAVFDKLLEGLMSLQVLVHQAAAAAGVAEEAAEAEPVNPDDVVAVTDDDASKTPVAEAEKKDTEEEKAAKMDAAAERRANVVAKAREFVKDIKTTRVDDKGRTVVKTEVAIMREALSADKTIKLDGMTDAEIRGAFAVVKPQAMHPSLARMRETTGPQGRTDGASEVSPRAKYNGNLANAWKTPAKG